MSAEVCFDELIDMGRPTLIVGVTSAGAEDFRRWDPEKAEGIHNAKNCFKSSCQHFLATNGPRARINQPFLKLHFSGFIITVTEKKQRRSFLETGKCRRNSERMWGQAKIWSVVEEFWGSKFRCVFQSKTVNYSTKL